MDDLLAISQHPSSAAKTQPDAAVAARIARGDKGALAELYDAWFDRALAGVRSMTGRDEAFCLDAVQEAFLRVVRSPRTLRSIRDAAHLDRWMMRVVHTAALDLLRSEARRVLRERRNGALRGEAGTGLRPGELAESIEGVAKRLAALPDEDRGLLRLRFGAGLSLAQTGEAAGTTTFAAHGKIRRLLERLREAEREAEADA